jgi:hypothetical protein
LKRRPHFKICRSLGNNKNTFTVPEGTWSRDWLSWKRPAAIYPAYRQSINRDLQMSSGSSW